jgi:hypothetical protein
VVGEGTAEVRDGAGDLVGAAETVGVIRDALADGVLLDLGPGAAPAALVRDPGQQCADGRDENGARGDNVRGDAGASQFAGQ